jgi:hypothetical protein
MDAVENFVHYYTIQYTLLRCVLSFVHTHVTLTTSDPGEMKALLSFRVLGLEQDVSSLALCVPEKATG